jgi:hypothetical protein
MSSQRVSGNRVLSWTMERREFSDITLEPER